MRKKIENRKAIEPPRDNPAREERPDRDRLERKSGHSWPIETNKTGYVWDQNMSRNHATSVPYYHATRLLRVVDGGIGTIISLAGI